MDKINVKALAIAFGVTWSIAMLISAWAAIFGWAGKIVEVMGSVYIGYEPTFLGGIIGAVWGFLDGAIGGALIAWIYNFSSKRK